MDFLAARYGGGRRFVVVAETPSHGRLSGNLRESLRNFA